VWRKKRVPQGKRTQLRGNKKKESSPPKEDERFEFLRSFLQYLDDWKEEVYSVDALQRQLTDSVLMEPEAAIPADEDERGAKSENVTPCAKKLLSSQTLEGIEITTTAFIEVVKFLHDEGTPYVNARTFSQDHIEQHFSKHRHRKANPNYSNFLQNNVNIRIQGQLGVKKGKSNTEDLSGGMVITEEPLPKRKKISAELSPNV